MIVANGYIQVKLSDGDGGLDENGYPIPTTAEWSEPMPCQYRATKLNFKAYSEGEQYTQSSYEILIDAVEFSHKELKLLSGNAEIGCYSVISSENLHLVKLVKIIV